MGTSRRDFLWMMTAALGTGIMAAGCGSGGGGGAFNPSPGGAAPNGFRFNDVLNSSSLALPTQNRSHALGAARALKSSVKASSTFQAFTGAVELTNGGQIFFHAIDEAGIVALYQGTLDFTGVYPRITDVHRVMGHGDTLPDGTTISRMGRGQANAQGTYVAVINQENAPPAIYVGSSGSGFQPLAMMGDTIPGGGGYHGGDFNNLAIDDQGNVAYVSSYVADGTNQNSQGLAYVIANDPSHPGSGILFSTQDVVPDGLGTTGGIGLIALSGSGHFVAQTTINGDSTNAGGSNTGGTGDAQLASVAISPNPGLVVVGTVGQLSARGSYANGATSDVTSQATWTSNDPSVATVDATAVVTGVAPGIATITATVSGVQGSVVVRVQALSIYVATGYGADGPASSIVAVTDMNQGTQSQTPNSLGLLHPYGVCVDSDGHVYIADSGNRQVLRIDGITGANPVALGGGATFVDPSGVALDGQGRLYVCDRGTNRIARFDGIGGGSPVSVTIPGDLGRLTDVCVDASGRIYGSTSNGQVVAYSDITATDPTVYGQGEEIGDGAYGICVDAEGRIYVAGFGNNHVVRIDTINGDNFISYPVTNPVDVAVDVTGHIYVTTQDFLTGDSSLYRIDDMFGTNLLQLTGSGFGKVAVTPIPSTGLLRARSVDPQQQRRRLPKGVTSLPNAVIVQGTIGQPHTRRVVAARGSTAINPLLRSSRNVAEGTAIYGPRITSGGIMVSVLHLDDSHLALYYGSDLIGQTGGQSPVGNTIASFYPPVCGGEDRIYYVLICEETAELVMYDGSRARTILTRGDSINGRIVNGLSFGLTPHQADLSDRLVLIVEYEDGTSGVVVGTPV